MLLDVSTRQLSNWRASLHDTSRDTSFRETLYKAGMRERDVRIFTGLTESILVPYLEGMEHYARNWKLASDVHREAGVYAAFADFIGPSPRQLLLDIGCGSANFFSAFGGRGHLLGIDINPFALALGITNLSNLGLEVSGHLESTLKFDPTRGFVLKPLPASDNLGLKGITLALDDIDSFETTRRLLYRNGTKADIVTFMLFGGTTPRKAIELLDMDHETSPTNPFHYVDIVVSRLHQVCRRGGRFIFGKRARVLIENGDDPSNISNAQIVAEETDRLNGRYASSVYFFRGTAIPLQREDRLPGVDIHITTSTGTDLQTTRPSPSGSERYLMLVFDAVVN